MDNQCADSFFECDGINSDSLPPTPEITYNWIDITKDFFINIKDLQLGELLHDGQLFGLFEAMSAIEMMDPKMDAGMMCNRGSPKALNFHQAVQAGKLKISNIEIDELIGIMDATMSCIVSWLEGHSLAQTVFTNIYLHQPHLIENKTLKAYCIAIYKLLDAIRECISKAQVFEEEDFQPMSYGYRLGANPQMGAPYDPSLDVTEQKCITMLRKQEEEINRKIKSDTAMSGMWLALGARIRFTRMLYQSLLLISKRELETNSPECLSLLLVGCSETMKIILKTACKGTQPDENSDAPNQLGFEPMINQRLLPPTFPRYTKIKPRMEALQFLEELVSRLRHAWKITSCNSFHSALDFFMEFSCNHSCILSRSALQLLYMCPSPASVASQPQLPHNVTPNNQIAKAQHMFYDVLKESVKSFVGPPIFSSKLLTPINPKAKEYADDFLTRCVRPFSVLLQVCGHNRARQRDKLALLLDEFSTLQEEADGVDALMCTSGTPTAYFGTWILYHVLRIMIAYLLSGLELELYSVHEYHYIFWYLYEFLYGWLSSALSRAELVWGEVRKRKNKRRAKYHANEALMAQVFQNICGGYFKAITAFRIQNKIKPPASEFDNEAVRYKHRFSALAVMTPPQVHYHEFREMTQPLEYEDPALLFIGGCKHFQQARTLLETITSPDQEVNDLLKVVKTNFIVLKLLAGGHKNDSMTPPEFDFSTHRHFPIIKLV